MVGNLRRAASAIIATISAGFAMLAIILLSTKFLSQNEQGLFFAFMSFGVFVQAGDFGLSYAVLQKASHFTRSPMLSLERFETKVRYFGIISAFLSTVVAGTLGIFSFSSRSEVVSTESIEWLAPWGVALVGLFLGQCANPILSLIEGTGQVTRAWRIRMFQAWAGGFVCCLALVFGWGLYGISLFWIAGAFVSLPLIFQRIYSKDLSPSLVNKASFNWRKDIWPFQWRIGLSIFSGFLIFRASTIVILTEQGAILAGQYGLALAAMNMMLSVTSSWPNSQATRLGQLVAGGEYKRAIAEAKKTLLQSTFFSIAAGLSVLALLGFAIHFSFDISKRTVSLSTFALILATGVSHHVVACQAVLLRSQLTEPLLLLSVAGGIINILGIFIASHFGTIQMVAVTGLAIALAGLFISTIIFRNQCKLWTNH